MKINNYDNKMSFLPPKGMRDIDSKEFSVMEKIRSDFIELANVFDFNFIEPSPIESLKTLEIKSGPNIRNEIYDFKDKSGRELGLRFDLTVGITRYVTSRRDFQFPVKLCAFSGMWRYDEPQYGRYRWLHQWDVEIFGNKNIQFDAEIMDFTYNLMNKVGLTNVSIEFGHRRIVEDYIRNILKITDTNSIDEMLRIMDKKGKKNINELTIEAKNKNIDETKFIQLLEFFEINNNDEILSELNKSAIDVTEITQILESLDNRKIRNVNLNFNIVRGLDYYSGIVFEVFDNDSPKLGALAGGGRYDTLPSLFGRPELGATGVAGGIERLIIALSNKNIIETPTSKFFVAYVNDKMKHVALELISNMRKNKIISDIDLIHTSLSKQLTFASSRSFEYVIIIGPNDYANGNVVIKHMSDGNEKTLPIKDLINYISSI